MSIKTLHYITARPPQPTEGRLLPFTLYPGPASPLENTSTPHNSVAKKYIRSQRHFSISRIQSINFYRFCPALSTSEGSRRINCARRLAVVASTFRASQPPQLIRNPFHPNRKHVTPLSHSLRLLLPNNPQTAPPSLPLRLPSALTAALLRSNAQQPLLDLPRPPIHAHDAQPTPLTTHHARRSPCLPRRRFTVQAAPARAQD